MMRNVCLMVIFVLCTACAGQFPAAEIAGADTVQKAPRTATPAEAITEPCVPSDDGIGGTGCKDE